MNRPIVFIPQEPMRKDGGRWVSKGLNLASTAEYGDMLILWGPDTSVISRHILIDEAAKAADQYEETRDYVVALGSPSLIAVLSWAIGCAGKQLRILEWDRAMQRYYPTLSEQLTERG